MLSLVMVAIFAVTGHMLLISSLQPPTARTSQLCKHVSQSWRLNNSKLSQHHYHHHKHLLPLWL